MAVEHVGPHTAIRLHEELGIDTTEKLWWAAHQQRIRKLPGFGPRSEARLKEAAAQVIGRNKEAHALGGVVRIENPILQVACYSLACIGDLQPDV